MNVSVVPERAGMESLETAVSFPTVITDADIQVYGPLPPPLLKRSLKL